MIAKNQRVFLPELEKYEVSLDIKREDVLFPGISGNKYRKLKYNILEAQTKKYTTLLTFGGAYSNHIAATAYAGKFYNFKTIGVIRGEELVNNWQNNPTLVQAHTHGMEFVFISREAYRNKTDANFLKELEKQFGAFYMVPEGGTNSLAIKGCEEILTQQDTLYNMVCCSVGTGGTVSGLINASAVHQKVIGFSALRGDFLKEDIRKFARKDNWELQTQYHFGGYAKVDKELINFINSFKQQTGIALDPIYTAKMLYGIIDVIKKGYVAPKSRILAIHTGGLQGIKGMNNILAKRKLPLLEI